MVELYLHFHPCFHSTALNYISNYRDTSVLLTCPSFLILPANKAPNLTSTRCSALPTTGRWTVSSPTLCSGRCFSTFISRLLGTHTRAGVHVRNCVPKKDYCHSRRTDRISNCLQVVRYMKNTLLWKSLGARALENPPSFVKVRCSLLLRADFHWSLAR
jgi:hypothetical protein